MGRKKKAADANEESKQNSSFMSQDDNDDFYQKTPVQEASWEEVVDTRKIKREERKQRKIESERLRLIEEQGQYEAQQILERQLAGSLHPSVKNNSNNKKKQLSKSSRARSVEDEDTWDNKTLPSLSSSSSSSQQQLKKKKAARSTVIGVSNEQEIVNAIRAVMNSLPSLSVPLAQVSEKFQTLTQVNWNKKLKAQYGSLRSFIANHSAEFVISAQDKVSLKPSTHVAPKSNSKSKSKNTNQNAHHSSQNDDDDDDDDDDEEDEDDEEAPHSKSSSKSSGASLSNRSSSHRNSHSLQKQSPTSNPIRFAARLIVILLLLAWVVILTISRSTGQSARALLFSLQERLVHFLNAQQS